MRHRSIMVGTVVFCLLCSWGLEAQQSDSSVSNNTNLPASSQSAAGTVPRLIKFAGEINPQITQITQITQTGQSGGGKNAAPAVLGFTFLLYELQEGGSPLWSESQKVQVDGQGHYTVLLGATQPEGLPLDLFTSGKALWLGTQAQLPGQAEQPRVLLVAVPYSLKSSDADTLGGLPASAYLLATANQTGLGTSTAATTNTSGSSAKGATSKETALIATTAVTPNYSSTGTTNYIPVFSDNTGDTANSVMYQSSGNIGLGTTNPKAPVHVYSSGSTNTTLPGFLFQRPDTKAETHFQHYFPGISYVSQNMYRDVGGLWYLDGATTPGMAMILSTNTGIEPANINFLTLPTGGATVPTKVMVIRSSGSVGIGTTAPAATLEVNGTAKFDGLVTFKSGQTFPGTGSVTSVASGAGLTGGPITSTGTLSIASGGVSDSMLASSYSGVGTCAAGNVVKALARNAAPTCVTAATGTVASITAGTGLSGGTIINSGTISNTGILSVGVNPGITTTGGQNPSLSIDSTVVPTLGASSVNTFLGINQFNNFTEFDAPVTFLGAQELGVFGSPQPGDSANPGYLYAYAGNNSAFLGYNNPTDPANTTMYLENDAANTPGLSGALVFETKAPNYGGQCTINVSGTLTCGAAGNNWAFAGYNTPVDSAYTTMYLENDAASPNLPYALVLATRGENYGGICNIDVSGNLTCTGTVGTAVRTIDARQVGVYTEQSSENWIDDYGAGALVSGVATINIEPQFAQTVTTDAGYHVFLTPNGDCEGLYVTQKSAASFEVRELKGGKSNVQFDYRIVAHRKGYETARLPDLTAQFQKKGPPPPKFKAPLARRPVRRTSDSVMEKQKVQGRTRE